MPEQIDFTISQAAAHYGVSTRTIHRIIQRLDLGRKIPVGGFGVILFTRDEFEEIGRHIRPGRGNPNLQTPEGREELRIARARANDERRIKRAEEKMRRQGLTPIEGAIDHEPDEEREDADVHDDV